MPLSLAEEAAPVVGIDPADRFQDAGVRLGARARHRAPHFALADGMYLPFASGAFDLVLSHAVIEHVADAPLYLRECARVLAPGGRVYLSTAPYLSFAGAHLPRLKLQVPLHLMFGRASAFATFQFLARHAPWTLKEPAHENSFIKARAARRESSTTTCSRRSGSRGCGRRSPTPACASSARSCTRRHRPAAAVADRDAGCATAR